jgi:hypothetical protein
MAKRFSYYYLQVNSGQAWDTLEQSESVAVLTSGLADQLASPVDAEIRIVGANFDQASEKWVYEQLFYIDQSSIDLGISDEAEGDGEDQVSPGVSDWDETLERPSLEIEDEDEAEDEPVAPSTREEPEPELPPSPLDEEGSDEIVGSREPEAEDATPPWMSRQASEDIDEESRPWGGFDDTAAGGDASDDIENEKEDDEEPVPWLRAQTRATSTGARNDEPFRFDDAPPPVRRRSIGKIFGFIFLVLFLSFWVAVGALVYLQHPLLLETADKLGIGAYLRMGSHDGAETMPRQGAKPEMSEKSSMAAGGRMAESKVVEPLTNGQVVRHLGVATALLGRWSPRKCETTYIEFDKEGYVRSVDGQVSPEKTLISETLQDEFVFYLRRSPELVEHYRRVTDNDIQLAGATTESGFLGSSEKA